jgi:hypothetical protein
MLLEQIGEGLVDELLEARAAITRDSLDGLPRSSSN